MSNQVIKSKTNSIQDLMRQVAKEILRNADGCTAADLAIIADLYKEGKI